MQPHNFLFQLHLWCTAKTQRAAEGYGPSQGRVSFQWEVQPWCIPPTKCPLFYPKKKKNRTQATSYTFVYETSRYARDQPNCECTCHVVVHPVEHDLWSTVPPRGHITGHFIVCVPCQTEIQDLHNRWWRLDSGCRKCTTTKRCMLHTGSQEEKVVLVKNVFFPHLEFTVFVDSQITGFQILWWK